MTATLLALPAYFDPLRDAGAWSQVVERAGSVRLVVLNPASGPGPARQDGYAALVGRLKSVGIASIGYVNTDYGARSSQAVRDDCAVFRAWYDVDGVFLDQARADVAGLDAYEQYVRDARSLGCRTVVLNPGVAPHRAYFDLANLVVAFEGDLAMHRRMQLPDRAGAPPPTRVCHLVYGVPTDAVEEVRRRAAQAGAGTLYITDGLLPNPWGTLASYWGAL